MSIINKIKELISNLKNPKLKNAHCVYFEGQTGLCLAKEFKKCNPINCKLYTINKLSTILDLQDKLQAKEQECEELKSNNKILSDMWKTADRNNAKHVVQTDKYKQALYEIEKILDNGTADTQTNNAKWLHEYYLARFCEIREIIDKAKE